MVGSAISMQTFMPETIPLGKVLAYHILTQCFVIVQAITWVMPPLVVEILIQDFTIYCENMINVIDQGYDIIEIYEKFESSFEVFFLAFYSWIQVFFIYYSFQLFTLLESSTTNSNFIVIFGFTLLILSIVLVIVTLANSVSNAHESLIVMSKKIQDQLLYEENQVEFSDIIHGYILKFSYRRREDI